MLFSFEQCKGICRERELVVCGREGFELTKGIFIININHFHKKIGVKNMLDAQTAVAQTEKWLLDVVIGCNFCPFAKREVLRKAVHYTVIEDDDWDVCAQAVVDECRRLEANEAIETTLILLTADTFTDFEDFLDWVDLVERHVIERQYKGVFQAATFHPDYRFADSEEDDAANYTNRSIVPMLHLLREASVSRAADSYTNIEDIPTNNIRFSRKKGLDYMQQLREACTKIGVVLLLCLAMSGALYAQKAHTQLRRGNEAYEAENYVEAEQQYRKGLDREPLSNAACYNLGNALYHQKRYTEATACYTQALAQAKTKEERAKMAYNRGNALLQQGAFSESALAYKMALKAKPELKNAQYNLNIALQKLRQEQQKTAISPNLPQNKAQNGVASDKTPPKSIEMPPDDHSIAFDKQKIRAEDLLHIIENEERKVHAKQKRFNGTRTDNGKDW